MAEFLTTAGTALQIENIIKDAKSKLVLVTPYLKLTKILFDRLRDVDRHGVKITMIFREKDISDDQYSSIAELKNLVAFSANNLHAKCYFNEDRMVITSLNLHEFSVKNNWEMGVLILRQTDPELFNQAVNETKVIQEASEKVPLSNINQPRKSSSKESQGFCIRCHRPKPFFPPEPFCRECYYVWAEFGNPFYEEQFCHSCGREERTSMNNPMCGPCYKQLSS